MFLTEMAARCGGWGCRYCAASVGMTWHIEHTPSVPAHTSLQPYQARHPRRFITRRVRRDRKEVQCNVDKLHAGVFRGFAIQQIAETTVDAGGDDKVQRCDFWGQYMSICTCTVRIMHAPLQLTIRSCTSAAGESSGGSDGWVLGEFDSPSWPGIDGRRRTRDVNTATARCRR
ncbi:hypothetical protein LZ31DRAFT_121558 [Colletotrichum somersetense]|nr:hypothetical protein LZ31DRAFT_121558 [Colletotrichum somersetense]